MRILPDREATRRTTGRGDQSRRRRRRFKLFQQAPGAFHAQRARPCRQERPTRRRRLHRHRLRLRHAAVAARAQWRKAAGQLRPTIRRLAEFMDEAGTDVLASMTFPKESWRQDQLGQPARTPERRDQTPHKRGWPARAYAAFGDGPARFPTKRRSPASSAPSLSSRMMNGRSSTPAI